MIHSKIVGTGADLPKQIVTNRDLEKKVETTHQWIVDRTGVLERRIADPEEATSDLAVRAAQRALEVAGVESKEVDLIIVATCTPDMPFPSTACIVQDRLGAKGAAAFDLSAVCSGFLFALSVADQYVRLGTYRTILVIGAEIMSRITDWTDRRTCVLFGDGAGAVVLQRSEDESRGILDTRLHSDGSLWDLICVPGGGTKFPPSEKVLTERMQFIKMKGNETFKVAVRNIEEVAREVLSANGFLPSDVDLMIPHQANLRIIQAAADRLGMRMDRVMINLDRFGNTSAASIPIALDEAVRSGRIRSGDLLTLVAFGSGLTWAASLIRW
ncbi:MAG TPA: beta-ketoacyl-ACP synthase III [Nitrospiria bacterium]|nr:beta-ketoacyl-ACP synthase III [Nitrospiria bacterium]